MRIIFTTALFFIIVMSIRAQDYPVDKGARILSADLSFSSANGDLFEDADGNSYTNFESSLGYDVFYIPNLAAGAGIGIGYSGQGESSSRSFSIGPSVSYYIGGKGSPVYPFVGIAYYYLSTTSDSGFDEIRFNGSDIILGTGILVPVYEHIGVTFSLAYEITKLRESESNESFDGNAFSLRIGISGLLF